MFQTIFHRGIRSGKADFHHSLPIQIAVRVFDLLDKITQPLFSWRPQDQAGLLLRWTRLFLSTVFGLTSSFLLTLIMIFPPPDADKLSEQRMW